MFSKQGILSKVTDLLSSSLSFTTEDDIDTDLYYRDLLQNGTQDEEEPWTEEYLWLVLLIISIAAALLAFLTYLFVTTSEGSDPKPKHTGDPISPDVENPFPLVQEIEDPNHPWGMKVKHVYEGDQSVRNSGISFSSLMSRGRLSTVSGRYSGKFEAALDMDDHLQDLVREKRHEKNVEAVKKKVRKSRTFSIDSKVSRRPKSQGNMESIDLDNLPAKETLKEQAVPEFTEKVTNPSV
eukprot:snap_masked-scaffold_9-processed-gene-6.25-mRNA-1 protein AED:1.00 eAED:1.00 QI:0/-1/0/0/-1/1/1/0/237